MDFMSMILGVILFTVGLAVVNSLSNLIGVVSDYIMVKLSVKIAWANHMIQNIKKLDGLDTDDPMAIGFEIEPDIYEEEE